jgi:large subunit ribosomal protein L21
MYAVIRAGGKQYRVAPGETIEIERLAGEVGAKVAFDEVIAVRTAEKLIAGRDAAAARVTGTIVRHGRHPKQMVMKYKKTKQYKIVRGHRQDFTAVQVNEIEI